MMVLPRGNGLFLVAAAGLVALAIGAGLFVLGPPATVRARRLDAERLNDLRQLSNAIGTSWAANGRLPASLDDLRRQQSWIDAASRDPETGASYGYRPSQGVVYELCATFGRESRQRDDSFWKHAAGPVCFSLKAASPR
jgi:hypothetical protein